MFSNLAEAQTMVVHRNGDIGAQICRLHFDPTIQDNVIINLRHNLRPPLAAIHLCNRAVKGRPFIVISRKAAAHVTSHLQ